MNERSVPTNVITGFLGAGKTSVILHLLAHKRSDEYWSVIVNEFGAVGIDGSLITGHRSTRNDVTVVEIPGGCMCCTTGPQLSVTLNRLLHRRRPDRLLIEASGLGHPREVVDTLGGPDYATVLDLQKIATVVDARKLADVRYTENTIFAQQIAIADVLIGNKHDLYRERDASNLLASAERFGARAARTVFTTHGALDLTWLQGATAAGTSTSAGRTAEPSAEAFAQTPIPEAGYLTAVNHGEGFDSMGWRFDPAWIFSRDRVLAFLRALTALRAKAVFVTEEGVYGYNYAGDSVMEVELDDCLESRIEIIARTVDGTWNDKLFACIQRVPPAGDVHHRGHD